MEKWLEYSQEVTEAKKAGKPVVALESTIISHGMPYPQNVHTAREVEQIIRENGAVPATIAILDGKIKIGLSDEELEYLGQSRDVEKASRRDLPYLLSTKKNGATTVAATMICAELAKIEVFVTGGIGGVHREAETTMDISADLQELAKTNVAVVCAGAKSILDLGLTLEYLETQGVPVIGFGTDSLPAFYTRTSPYNVNFRLDTPEAIAEMIETKWELGLVGGVVVANPIPEEDALEESFIANVIEKALDEAIEKQIGGKQVTPFLLGKVKELTDGKSLVANIALVKNNARVGAKIAASLAKQRISL
nr:pseudouridine-5'-phosphate glycosidase [Mesobacillus selenatarsenatis]